MAVDGGVRFYCHCREAGELFGQNLEIRDLRLAGLLDLDLVQFERAEVFGQAFWDDGFAVGNEVVAGVARLHLDQVALLADVDQVIDQHDQRAAVLALLDLVADPHLLLREFLSRRLRGRGPLGVALVLRSWP